MSQLHGNESELKVNLTSKLESYLSEKKIPELFNRLLTQIIHDKPKNIRQHIIEQLSSLKNNKSPANYFTSEDFETMFDAYDIAGEGNVDYACLLQALSVAGVKNPEKALAEDFPGIRTNSLIPKPQFSQILVAEFTKRGYSN